MSTIPYPINMTHHVHNNNVAFPEASIAELSGITAAHSVILNQEARDAVQSGVFTLTPVLASKIAMESACALVFFHLDDELMVLLVNSADGRVDGPGGKVDDGETSQQAALREFAEELRVFLGDMDHLDTQEPVSISVGGTGGTISIYAVYHSGAQRDRLFVQSRLVDSNLKELSQYREQLAQLLETAPLAEDEETAKKLRKDGTKALSKLMPTARHCFVPAEDLVSFVAGATTFPFKDCKDYMASTAVPRLFFWDHLGAGLTTGDTTTYFRPYIIASLKVGLEKLIAFVTNVSYLHPWPNRLH